MPASLVRRGSNGRSPHHRDGMASPEKFFSTKRLCFLLVLMFANLAPQLPAANGTGSSDFQTGVEGSISMSPAHGGPLRQGMPGTAPLPHVSLLAEDSAGAISAAFETDDDGRFHVGLKPGHYIIRSKGPKMKLGSCGPFTIDVPSDGFLKVSWSCDSGLR